MALRGQTDSTTTPRTPESNGRSQPGATGPRATIRRGGSRDAGFIPQKPAQPVPQDAPFRGNLESRHPGPEAGRGQGAR